MSNDGRGRYSDEDMRHYREEMEKRENEKRTRAKKRRRKARIKRKIFGFFFLILIILSLVIILLKTPLFSVKTLVIEGNDAVSDETISYVSGFSVGESIFARGNSYAEKALTALPYISEAKISKKLPSTVNITVTELGGAYLLKTDKRNIIIDKNGKSIKEPSDGDEIGLPVIYGCSDSGFKLGGYVSLPDEESTKTLYRCLECIESYGFTNVTELNLSDEYNIWIMSGGSLKIKIGSLGSDDELSYKMAYIKEVMSKLPTSVKGVIDASHPESGVSYRSEDPTKESTEDENGAAEEETAEGEEGKTEENSAQTEENL